MSRLITFQFVSRYHYVGNWQATANGLVHESLWTLLASRLDRGHDQVRKWITTHGENGETHKVIRVVKVHTYRVLSWCHRVREGRSMWPSHFCFVPLEKKIKVHHIRSIFVGILNESWPKREQNWATTMRKKRKRRIFIKYIFEPMGLYLNETLPGRAKSLDLRASLRFWTHLTVAFANISGLLMKWWCVWTKMLSLHFAVVNLYSLHSKL